MSFFKKNLLFCMVVIVCLAVFSGGAFLAYSQYGDVKKARSSLSNVENQLSGLLNRDPAPSDANLTAAEENLKQLIASLANIRDGLQPGTALQISEDGISVIAGIQQYISRLQREAARHKNKEGDAMPIQTPNNFAFGFEQFVREAQVPENAAKAAILDKQRQILSFLMDKLFKADPQAISSVQREVLEISVEGDKRGFTIAPSLSARVPGAIETVAFSLTFSGYTNTLREFLNSLADFELPIVVRSIQVTRPAGKETVAAPPRRPAASNIFDLFGEASPAPSRPQPTAEVQKPVIEENVSQFTVILEFIEVVLPDANTQEVSDPA
ncbi:MAG: hypothetical protein ACNA77_01895 [Opitutales bacterium]